MPASDLIDLEPDDYYLSDMLGQYVYTYRCPKCGTWGFVTQLGDVTQCDNCNSFLRIDKKPLESERQGT